MLNYRIGKGTLSVCILVFAWSLMSSTALFAQAELASHDPRPAKVDSLFSASDRPDMPGWAVGVIQDGRLVYKRYYGMANIEERIPITSETLFAVGSMTKQFTAACIALLVVRGDISLDDDIRTYVPEFPDYGSTVTIRHLVYMMSGVKDNLNTARSQWDAGKRFGGSFDNEDALNIILQHESLGFEPGENKYYMGSNYILLAEIIKRVSGRTLREFADENIFQPLGMRHTLFHDNTASVSNYAVDYHRKRVSGIWGYGPLTEEYFDYRYNRVDCGPGGLLTTVEDLYLWDQNLYDNKLAGGSEFLDLMLSTGKLNNGDDVEIGFGIWQDQKYGFGLVHAEYQGFKGIYHPGIRGDFQSTMMRFPEEKLTFILLANYEYTGGSRSIDIGFKFANVYLSGQGPADSQGCDFNADGRIDIADVIALLLVARDNASDPRVDWNSDGAYSIDDAILLAQDIMNGHCPEASVLLASASDLEPVTQIQSLSPEDIAYLEHMMSRMNLTPEQEAAFRLALYGEAGVASLPKVFSLAQNVPNPFNPATTLSYSVPEGLPVKVSLKVYDIRGRLVRTPVDAVKEAGTYSVFWDGADESGRQVSSGVYLYRMQAGDFVQTRKMVLLK